MPSSLLEQCLVRRVQGGTNALVELLATAAIAAASASCSCSLGRNCRAPINHFGRCSP
jgi:hypothetical protein